MKKIAVTPGEIFCIPLFMPKDDWKLKSKLSDADLDKDFAFGRVIDTSSSVLIEVFNKISSAKTDINEIINSGIMFSPVQIFWDAIIKKRWRIISQTENYDKYKDSNFNTLKMAFGLDGDFRLRHLDSAIETSITRDDLSKYEYATVWFPIDFENRILKSIT